MRTRLLLLFLLFSGLCVGQEICDNGIDDDGDGLIDLNDADCRCGNQTPVPSIIPNASFESHTQCPANFSELAYCTGWIQATTATTDYYNICGIIAPAIREIPALMHFPDGEGISAAIFEPQWNEYLGSCLTAPMLKDTTYQLTFNIAALPISNNGGTCNDGIIDFDPVNVTIYGTGDCVHLPLSTVISPDRASPDWVALGSAVYIPQSRWGQLTITFTPPTEIKAIMIGAPPNLPPSYSVVSCLPYFLFDNLTLNESSKFEVNIDATGNFCVGTLALAANLSVTVSNDAVYQWYKEGIAIAGATQNTFVIPPGSGNLAQYTVRVTDGAKCYVSPNYTINTSSPAPEISLVQPNCRSLGSITIHTPSDFYSFDNGVTWSHSNQSVPLPSGLYYVRTKTASGCTSLGSVANLSYFSNASAIDYTRAEPACGVNGSITITTPGAEYSFDGGVTWQATNSKDLPFGFYNINIRDSTGCVTGENYVYLQEPFLNQPVISYLYATCGSGGSITIDTGYDLYSIDDGVTWSTSNVFTGLAEDYYFVKVKNAVGCASERMYVYIGTETIYEPAGSANVVYCQYTTPEALTVTGTDILWYDTPTGGTPATTAPVPNTDVVGEVWYYATQTIRGCEGPRKPIRVTVKETPGLATATQFYDYCQDLPATQLTATGIGLRWYTSATGGIGSNVAPVPSTRVAGTFFYYVCQSLNGCEGDRIPIEVLIYPTPQKPVTDTELFYEQYNDTKPLTAHGLNLTWYNNLYEPLPEIPVVSSQELGKTIYYVSQTINGCVGILQKITVSILPNYITIKYPKYFTPNGDSMHETWNVYTPDFGIRATTYIFDKYGKLIIQLYSPGNGWDGTFNGNVLPSTDYWFTTFYTEYGVQKQVRSHFSLIR